jgi:CheY-like chemotaxis protein
MEKEDRTMATMLIVADDHITVLALQDHLTRLGHTVLLPVSSPEAAFAALQVHHPQVVFMAIHLHENLEGLTVGNVIETTEGIPVI